MRSVALVRYMEIRVGGSSRSPSTSAGGQAAPQGSPEQAVPGEPGRGSAMILFPEIGLPQPSLTGLRCKSDKSEGSWAGELLPAAESYLLSSELNCSYVVISSCSLRLEFSGKGSSAVKREKHCSSKVCGIFKFKLSSLSAVSQGLRRVCEQVPEGSQRDASINYLVLAESSSQRFGLWMLFLSYWFSDAQTKSSTQFSASWGWTLSWSS